MSQFPSELSNPADVVADLALRSSPLPGMSWRASLALAAIGFAAAAGFAVQDQEPMVWFSLLSATWFAVRGWRGWRRSRFQPRLFLTHQYIRAPSSPQSSRHVELPFPRIEALSSHSTGTLRVLILSTAGRRMVLTSAQLGSPERLVSIENFVRQRIEALPDGAERVHDFRSQALMTMRAVGRRPILTHALLALMAAAFAVQHQVGAFENELQFVRLGANVPVLVADGEWWRLASATFLHGSLLHFAVNAFALLQLGALLERLLGWQRLLWLFLLSATGGALASALAARGVLSVGASTALFGLLGALAWLQFRHRALLPAFFRQTGLWWLTIGGLNSALPLLVPAIDSAAHLGGFLSGVLAAALAVPHRESFARPRPGFLLQAAIVAVAGAFLAALAIAGQSAAQNADPRGLRLLDRLAESPRTEPELLNIIAWTTAIDPGAAVPALQIALKGAERAVAENPKQLEYVDTLATIYHRLGQSERAARLQLGVLESQPDPLYAAQALRFTAEWSDRGCVHPRAYAVPNAPSCLQAPDDAAGPGIGLALAQIGDRTAGLAVFRVHSLGVPACTAVSMSVPSLSELRFIPLCWLEPSPLPSHLGPQPLEPGTIVVLPVDQEPLRFPGPVQDSRAPTN